MDKKSNESKPKRKISEQTRKILIVVLSIVIFGGIAFFVWLAIVKIKYSQRSNGTIMNKILEEKGINGLQEYPYGITKKKYVIENLY